MEPQVMGLLSAVAEVVAALQASVRPLQGPEGVPAELPTTAMEGPGAEAQGAPEVLVATGGRVSLMVITMCPSGPRDRSVRRENLAQVVPEGAGDSDRSWFAVAAVAVAARVLPAALAGHPAAEVLDPSVCGRPMWIAL